uniref:Uncharacterized protein n=1 Tax=Euplotes harpa TaxID=151035 RepID=A0A7S3J697_9SPIT
MYQEFLVKEKGKTFNVNHDMERFAIFKANVEKIISHNADPESTFTMGINHLTDLTAKEAKEYYHIMADQKCAATASPRNSYLKASPSSWNWVDQGIVSPVKNQGECGSCWTFSTTGAMESHYKLATGHEVLLSEQELVDCPDEKKYDCHKCEGGLPSYAFNFIRDFGLEEENDYPYRAKNATCHYDRSKAKVTTSGPFNITAGDEQQLKDELYNHGPVSVAFEVVDDFMNYHSGVYSSKHCKNSPDDVNHAVLAVGYGTEKGVDYWLVKNSWSENWGDKGYFKIKRGVNMCGIAVCNSYPLDVRSL